MGQAGVFVYDAGIGEHEKISRPQEQRVLKDGEADIQQVLYISFVLYKLFQRVIPAVIFVKKALQLVE